MTKQSRTLIVATIGPSSEDVETLKTMIESGMDMARFNMSWGTHEWHEENINKVRSVAQNLNKNIPIIMDLSGPRMKSENGHHIDPNAEKTITEKDLIDIDLGIKMNVDYFAMSYVASSNDITELKGVLSGKNNSAKIIAKIERKEAVESIEEIAKNSDMIMVARGDLGNAYPVEEIPFIEKDLLIKLNEMNKPTIVATQMLLSMTENNSPTRAEVTDEVFAIINGAEAVMLSEETSTGKYPIEAIKFMESIALNAESHNN